MRGAARSAAAALVLLSWTCSAAQFTPWWATSNLLVVKSVRLTDNGDNDGFADPHETVNVFLTLRNVSDIPKSGIGIALVTDDPRVDCVLTPVVVFGSLGARESREATVPLSFRVAGVARTTPEEELTAVFDVLIWGDDFDASTRPCGYPPGPCRQPPQQVTLDLDVDVSGGLLPTSFTEGFESGGFGSFTTMTLDVGKASNALSDGHRCQYNDPDFPNSNSFGNTHCYLGFTNPLDNAYDWHVHGLASPDGGRAYLGNNSLHWGVHPGAASADTTRLKQLDAIRTANPINLGWNAVVPELRFKHQVGLLDGDYEGNFETAIDRGVVQVQLANSAGQATGNWRKISPYENLYDSQAVDIYTNCLFDPTDDGNDEDDYFDPNDPNRRLGPSSTCHPEFAFSRLGAIFFSDSFDPADIHHASDGPGLRGSLGPGTWVESKFSLDRYRGRRVRIRFLATALEIDNQTTWAQVFPGWNPIEAEDGWYIDDIRVTNTLTSAATVRVDTADRSALPGCPAACSSLSASLAADPNPSSMPGEPIVLDASASAADTCPGGPLLYRFWHDRTNDGVLTEPPDRLLRSWTDDPILVDAPHYTSRYAVEVQCSSQRTCADHAGVLVTVPCVAPLFSTLRFDFNWWLAWDVPVRVEVLRGNLDALRANGGDFQGTVIECPANPYFFEGAQVFEEPAPGSGFYYLAREAGPTYRCGPSWGTGSPAELPGAGGDRDADLALDPNQCP